MEFQDVVRRRRMIRNYEDRPLPDGLLDRLLDNGLRAPSAGFSQGWAFLVLQGRGGGGGGGRVGGGGFPRARARRFRLSGFVRGPRRDRPAVPQGRLPRSVR